MDPTKLRNRRFNTGVGARAPPQKAAGEGGAADGGMGRTWTETPEQKRQRLEDEVMGVTRPAALGGSGSGGGGGSNGEATRERQRKEEAREAERKIREYNERNERGRTLVDAHHQRKETKKKDDGSKSGAGAGANAKAGGKEREEEDDPSKRAFDREKDMKVGGSVGHKQRRDMLNRAKEMGGRFSGGSYL